MTQYRIVSTIAAATAALLAAAAFPAAAQPPPAPAQQPSAPASYKIGFVNTERVMRDSRASQQIQKNLEAEFQKRRLRP